MDTQLGASLVDFASVNHIQMLSVSSVDISDAFSIDKLRPRDNCQPAPNRGETIVGQHEFDGALALTGVQRNLVDTPRLQAASGAVHH